MPDIDLKAYTSRAVELESAIYTQKKLMKEHSEKIQKQRPVAPSEDFLDKPVKPNKSDYIVQRVSLPILSIVAVIVIILAAIVVYSSVTFDDVGIGTFLWGILGILAVGYFIGLWKTKQSDDKQQKQKDKEYENATTEYNKLLATYNNNLQIIHANHLKEMEAFNIQDRNYSIEADVIIKKHNDVLSSLESALQALYEQNVVFPKYRNMVAITTINEYLMSGRCYELEGPNGAYNLYEMELRQNIIIGHLSSIVSSLEQIRNNQFSLYTELKKANTTVDNILNEVRGVNENTRLTAYFAGVTALIEATPKVYVGRTF